MKGRIRLKLASGFQTVEVDGKRYLTSGVRGFSGQIVCNETSSFILKKLAHDTTAEKIVRSMCRRFDAPREQIEADVEDVLQTLRRIGALQE